MTDIKIRIAEEIDAAAIREFLVNHFLNSEPINGFHVRKDETWVPWKMEWLDKSIEMGITLLAFCDNELVGFLIAVEIRSDDKPENSLPKLGSREYDVCNLLSYVTDKADLFNRLKVSRSLHVFTISVHPNHLRKGIASKLFECCIDNGKSKNFPTISVDCTSFFTTRIAQKFGLKCLSTVTYDEYEKHIGKQLFIPQAPHCEIKTFAMFLNESEIREN